MVAVFHFQPGCVKDMIHTCAFPPLLYQVKVKNQETSWMNVEFECNTWELYIITP